MKALNKIEAKDKTTPKDNPMRDIIGSMSYSDEINIRSANRYTTPVKNDSSGSCTPVPRNFTRFCPLLNESLSAIFTTTLESAISMTRDVCHRFP